ncbi:MAG: hypothetical protein AVDCRST_MAG13-2704, partial [uncultured Solirubrobacteraceae bacterium]
LAPLVTSSVPSGCAQTLVARRPPAAPPRRRRVPSGSVLKTFGVRDEPPRWTTTTRPSASTVRSAGSSRAMEACTPVAGGEAPPPASVQVRVVRSWALAEAGSARRTRTRRARRGTGMPPRRFAGPEVTRRPVGGVAFAP